jgi:pyruvate dehydrogenase E1 component alpha subunit
MPGERVDGNDVLAVREAGERLLRAAREERRPSLLETMTYRYRGHSVADAGKVYRTEKEISSWKHRDPIERFAALLEERGLLSPEERDAIRKEVSQEVAAAIREAAAAPSPAVDGIRNNVYGDPAWREQFARMDAGAPFGERQDSHPWQT